MNVVRILAGQHPVFKRKNSICTTLNQVQHFSQLCSQLYLLIFQAFLKVFMIWKHSIWSLKAEKTCKCSLFLFYSFWKAALDLTNLSSQENLPGHNKLCWILSIIQQQLLTQDGFYVEEQDLCNSWRKQNFVFNVRYASKKKHNKQDLSNHFPLPTRIVYLLLHFHMFQFMWSLEDLGKSSLLDYQNSPVNEWWLSFCGCFLNCIVCAFCKTALLASLLPYKY